MWSGFSKLGSEDILEAVALCILLEGEELSLRLLFSGSGNGETIMISITLTRIWIQVHATMRNLYWERPLVGGWVNVNTYRCSQHI